MRITYILKVSILSIISLCFSITAMFDLTKEQQEKIELAMKKMQEHRASLTPAQRTQFDRSLRKQVQEQMQQISRMSPTKREKLFNQVRRELDSTPKEQIAQLKMSSEPEEYVSTPLPQLTMPDKKKVKKSAEVKTEKVKDFIETLDALIKKINQFSEQLSGIKEPEELINKWILSNKIYPWAGRASDGNLFMQTFDILKSILMKLKKDDPTTQKYLYLGEKSKDQDELLGQLKMILPHIKKYVQSIQIDKGEVRTPESKRALQDIINYLARDMKTIIEKIIALINQFDPKAIIAEEKKLQKLAEEVAKAREEGTDNGEWGQWGNGKWGNRRLSRDSGGYYGRPTTRYPSYKRGRSPWGDSSYGRKIPSRRTPSRPRKDAGKKDDKKGKPSKPSKPSKPGKPKITPSDKKIDKKKDKDEISSDDAFRRVLTKLANNFFALSDDKQAFDQIKKHIEDPADQTPKAQLIDTARRAFENIKKIKNNLDKVSKYVKKIKQDDIKKKYEKQLQQNVSLHKDDLNDIAKKIGSIKKPTEQANPKMFWAFYGGDKVVREKADLEKKEEEEKAAAVVPQQQLQPEVPQPVPAQLQPVPTPPVPVKLTETQKTRLRFLKSLPGSVNLNALKKEIETVYNQLKKIK